MMRRAIWEVNTKSFVPTHHAKKGLLFKVLNGDLYSFEKKKYYPSYFST